MQLDQLVAFDRVAREASFSRAALSLGLGQPAISSRIQALEESVGGTLFVRGRNIRLTALGESFLPYVRRALEVLREGAQASRLAQEGRGNAAPFASAPSVRSRQASSVPRSRASYAGIRASSTRSAPPITKCCWRCCSTA